MIFCPRTEMFCKHQGKHLVLVLSALALIMQFIFTSACCSRSLQLIIIDHEFVFAGIKGVLS